VGEVHAGIDVFAIPAIEVVAGELRVIAQVLGTMSAIPACLVGATQPRDANPHAERALDRGPIDDLADDLVARDEGITAWLELAGTNVEIGTTNGTRAYLQAQVAWRKLCGRNVLYLQG
jgi:hypothetical protein